MRFANPHIWLPGKLALIFLAIYLAAYVAAPTEERVVGTYVSSSDSGLIAIKLRSGGTYVEYDQTQELNVGRWRLTSKFLIFKSVVLEDSYRLPVTIEDLHRGKGEYSYPLFHYVGDLCFRAGPAPEYWCKQ